MLFAATPQINWQGRIWPLQNQKLLLKRLVKYWHSWLSPRVDLTRFYCHLLYIFVTEKKTVLYSAHFLNFLCHPNHSRPKRNKTANINAKIIVVFLQFITAIWLIENGKNDDRWYHFSSRLTLAGCCLSNINVVISMYEHNSQQSYCYAGISELSV